MSEKKSVKKKFIYNLIYPVLLIINHVAMPYVSRVLWTAQVGQYLYSYSIVSYFVLFATLWFSFYAQREIKNIKMISTCNQGNAIIDLFKIIDW